jgi:hypothetical protein
MARRPMSAAASRIRIEDEVWEEAFSSRVSSRRRAARSHTAAPARAPQPSDEPRAPSARPRLRLAEDPIGEAPSRYDLPADEDRYAVPPPPDGARRTIRIEGRGAEPLRVLSRSRAQSTTSPRPRTVAASPDRLAMWATLLGFLLVLVAILSSHF